MHHNTSSFLMSSFLTQIIADRARTPGADLPTTVAYIGLRR